MNFENATESRQDYVFYRPLAPMIVSIVVIALCFALIATLAWALADWGLAFIILGWTILFPMIRLILWLRQPSSVTQTADDRVVIGKDKAVFAKEDVAVDIVRRGWTWVFLLIGFLAGALIALAISKYKVTIVCGRKVYVLRYDNGRKGECEVMRIKEAFGLLNEVASADECPVCFEVKSGGDECLNCGAQFCNTNSQSGQHSNVFGKSECPVCFSIRSGNECRNCGEKFGEGE